MRVEGVLLLSALVAADFFAGLSRQSPIRALLRTSVLGLMGILPFLLWTVRNYLLYTPDTFNTLGFRFFGQPSKRLFAPKSLWVDGEAVWFIPIKSLMLMLDGLLSSIVSARVGQVVPFAVSTFLVIGLMFLGFKKWRTRAHMFEIMFTVLMLALFCYMHFNDSPNRLVVNRYWTPILAPMLIILVLGSQRLIKMSGQKSVRLSLKTFFLGIFLLAVAHGVASIRYYYLSSAGYAEGLQSMRKAVALVESRTGPDEVIAVTDWGVMPFLLDRRTVKTLNDRSNVYTLSLLKTDQARFLIIVAGLGRSKFIQSKELVGLYPEIFQQVNSYPTEDGLFSSSVYEIDQHQLKELAASAHFAAYCGQNRLLSGFCTTAPEN